MSEKVRIPSKYETAKLARDIIKEYENTEIDIKNPPRELLLAKGALALYGEMEIDRLSSKYNLDNKYLKRVMSYER